MGSEAYRLFLSTNDAVQIDAALAMATLYVQEAYGQSESLKSFWREREQRYAQLHKRYLAALDVAEVHTIH